MRSLIAMAVVLLIITACSRKAENPRSQGLVNAQADALKAKILLAELRDGRLTNALELLEEQVDSSIILISGFLSKASDSEREMAVGTLRSLKTYRVANPRKQEAILPDTESLVSETEQMRQASNILNQVK